MNGYVHAGLKRYMWKSVHQELGKMYELHRLANRLGLRSGLGSQEWRRYAKHNFAKYLNGYMDKAY